MTDTKVGYRGGYEQKDREGEMRENRLIEFLDDLIGYADHQADFGHKSDQKKWKNRKAMLTEIKRIVSEVSCRNDDNDNELVNEILEISLNVHTDISNIPISEAYGDKDGYAREDVVIKAKAEIRKLLQSRQPEKVTVTMVEIDKVWGYQPTFMNFRQDLVSLLKSKGIKVTEK